MKFLLIVLTLTLCSVAWCDQLPAIEKFFKNFGKYEFKIENGETILLKTYYTSRELKLSWTDALMTCESFDMNLVELSTEAEADFFLSLCKEQESHLNSDYFHVGGSHVGVGANEFYWMTTGQRVNYTMNYATGEPNSAAETSLVIHKEAGPYKFADGSPDYVTKFICQRIAVLKKKIIVPLAICNPATVEWFPHPSSCQMFVLCFHGNPIVKRCAPNAEQKKCISSRILCCPYEDDVLNPVFLADTNDCSKYSVCFSGKPIKKNCAAGLFFDVKSNWCTLPVNNTCGSRPIIDAIIVPPIDLTICKWYGNVMDENGVYIKSLCYYDKEATHEEASNICVKNGMRLLRIEDSLVQTKTFAYLLDMFGRGSGGTYHVSGKNIAGSWYHDEETLVYNNMQWKDGNVPDSGCLTLCGYIPMSFDGLSCAKKIPSICEYDNQNEFIEY